MVLLTPVTSAPKYLASCTAKVPILPEAPLIRTLCPLWIFPLSLRKNNVASPPVDNCVFDTHCLPESSLHRRLELLNVEPSDIRVLIENGVQTIDDLADLDLQSLQARNIQVNPSFSKNLGILITKAKSRRSTLPRDSGKPKGVNNRPIATSLDLEYGGKMYGHLCGFDPDFARYSVGNLLLLKILKQCIVKKISEYDFMQGDESYKFDWTKKYRQNINVKFFNKKFSSMILSLGLMGYQLIGLSSQMFKKIKNRISPK